MRLVIIAHVTSTAPRLTTRSWAETERIYTTWEKYFAKVKDRKMG
jgi:hypothetical protein